LGDDVKSPQTPEEAVRELREYINTHIQKWSQKQVARVMLVSEDEYEMIERQRRRLLPDKAEPLADYLVQSGWLDAQSRNVFKQDLLSGISVVRYVSGYRDSHERRQLIPPTIQAGKIVKDANDLALLRESEGTAGVFVGREQPVIQILVAREKQRLH
jgi:transcriptional regulator with XRE-family HTH domain